MAWQLPSKSNGLVNLLDDEDVPSSQKLPFILSGYRPQPAGACGLLRTIFMLHNETGNMWTHLVGFVYFLSLGAQLVYDLWDAEEFETDPLWLLMLLVASSFALFWSFSYHLCNCSSDGCMRECMYRMDLSGIVMLITASYFTGIALGYRCFPSLRRIYLCYAACVAVLIGGPLVRPSLVRSMPRYLIGCCGLGLVPAFHFIRIASHEDVATVLPYLVAMFGCYGAGAFFFVTHWPEKLWPGRFDILGHSHQVWHVFVVLAAASWAKGCHVFLHHFSGPHCMEVLNGAPGTESLPE